MQEDGFSVLDAVIFLVVYGIFFGIGFWIVGNYFTTYNKLGASGAAVTLMSFVSLVLTALVMFVLWKLGVVGRNMKKKNSTIPKNQLPEQQKMKSQFEQAFPLVLLHLGTSC